MRFPAYLNLIDIIDEAAPSNSTLLALRRGQSYGPRVAFKLLDGLSPESMAGRTFRTVIRRSHSNTQVLYTGTSTDAVNEDGSSSVVIEDAPAGVLVVLNLDEARSLLVPVGRWVYGLSDTTGGKNESMLEGTIEVKEGIGR
jgi:hypothetical protein